MYEFQGLFTRQPSSSFEVNSASFTLRDLRPRYPFYGIRIRPIVDDAGENLIFLEAAVREIVRAGVVSGLALSYSTFGGAIEYLAGFEVVDSKIVRESRFESGIKSRDDDLNALFIAKMSAYGLPPESNGFFFPFERGFWGE